VVQQKRFTTPRKERVARVLLAGGGIRHTAHGVTAAGVWLATVGNSAEQTHLVTPRDDEVLHPPLTFDIVASVGAK
jgi:hypothetical protein